MTGTSSEDVNTLLSVSIFSAVDEAEPPRLTYLITGLQYGGANIGMVRLLSEFSQDEFNITVVSLVETPHDVVDQLPDHVRVVPLDISSPLEIYQISRLIPVLRQTDILVCSLFHATAVGMPIATLLRIPTKLVWQHNTSYSSRNRQIIYGVLYWLADQVLADSEATRSMLVDSMDISGEKISVLPLAGVDTERFQVVDRNGGNSITVGTIGRLVEQKDYMTLIEVAEQLPGYQFQIVGDGPKYDELRRRAPENVEFCGRVGYQTLLDRLRNWEIYFQPSRYEGLGITVTEAMACELPVVASAVGGITESVVPGETGFLCQPKDVECFSERLRQLGDDPELRIRMGQRGRERVKENYSAEALADAFRDALAAAKNR